MMADDPPLFGLPAESADSTRRDYASIRERASLTRFRAHIRHFSSSAARADSAWGGPAKKALHWRHARADRPPVRVLGCRCRRRAGTARPERFDTHYGPRLFERPF